MEVSKIIQDFTILVLKPMVTWGSPFEQKNIRYLVQPPIQFHDHPENIYTGMGQNLLLPWDRGNNHPLGT
jgi:hypothetical protein